MAATGEVDAKLLDPGGPAGRLGIDRAGRGAPTAQRDRDPDLMVEEGIGFLRRNKDRPFFLYFAINEPHYPYQGDPKWLQRYAQLNYPRNLYTGSSRRWTSESVASRPSSEHWACASGPS
jgi:hypothetical protein